MVTQSWQRWEIPFWIWQNMFWFHQDGCPMGDACCKNKDSENSEVKNENDNTQVYDIWFFS